MKDIIKEALEDVKKINALAEENAKKTVKKIAQKHAEKLISESLDTDIDSDEDDDMLSEEELDDVINELADDDDDMEMADEYVNDEFGLDDDSEYQSLDEDELDNALADFDDESLDEATYDEISDLKYYTDKKFDNNVEANKYFNGATLYSDAGQIYFELSTKEREYYIMAKDYGHGGKDPLRIGILPLGPSQKILTFDETNLDLFYKFRDDDVELYPQLVDLSKLVEGEGLGDVSFSIGGERDINISKLKEVLDEIYNDSYNNHKIDENDMDDLDDALMEFDDSMDELAEQDGNISDSLHISNGSKSGVTIVKQKTSNGTIPIGTYDKNNNTFTASLHTKPNVLKTDLGQKVFDYIKTVSSRPNEVEAIGFEKDNIKLVDAIKLKRVDDYDHTGNIEDDEYDTIVKNASKNKVLKDLKEDDMDDMDDLDDALMEIMSDFEEDELSETKGIGIGNRMKQSQERNGGIKGSDSYGSKSRSGMNESAIVKKLKDTLRAKISREKKLVEAVGIYKEQLEKLSVLNTNMAHVTSLFLENASTKQEKLNIAKRFDKVSNVTQSKKLYESISLELKGKTIPTKTNVDKKVRGIVVENKLNINEDKYKDPSLTLMEKMNLF